VIEPATVLVERHYAPVIPEIRETPIYAVQVDKFRLFAYNYAE